MARNSANGFARLLGLTSASSDHIFGIILYPLRVKSKMWSEGLSQVLLAVPTFFIIPPTLTAKLLNHNGLKYY
jgi:hypothetical protein